MRLLIARSPVEIERQILSHEACLAELRKVAGAFAALDVRPFYCHDGKITYTRELNIPADLIALIHAEAEAIAELRAELYA